MANKYDLTYQCESVSASISFCTHIGGLIPAGKTRFLTYLRVDRCAHQPALTNITGQTALVASVAISNAALAQVSAATTKIPIYLQYVGMSSDSAVVSPPNGSFMKEIPENPDINKPLISVAGDTSAWMTLGVRSGPESRIYAAYYDE